MSFFKRERPKAGPTLETNASAPADTELVEAVPASAGEKESFERETLLPSNESSPIHEGPLIYAQAPPKR